MLLYPLLFALYFLQYPIHSIAFSGTSEGYSHSCFEDPANCCFPESKWEQYGRVRHRCERNATTDEYPCAIKLAANGWVGSEVNVFLAKIFLEEFLGYPVEIILGAFESDMWGALQAEAFDAVLEVWPSGHVDNYYSYVLERSAVVDGGALGAQGAIGWFMPTWVLDELDPALEYWRTLLDPEKMALFANPRGEAQCCLSDLYTTQELPCVPVEGLGGTPAALGGLSDASSCTAGRKVPTAGGRFVAGGHDWVQYDDQIIRNLGLNLTVEYALTEEGLVEVCEESHAQREPVLFYFWKPHALFQLYNLTRVMLPAHSADCWGRAAEGGVACDYPVEVLYKVYNRRLRERAPDAALLLDALRYASTEQQESILADIMRNPGKSVGASACQWARANEDTWSLWTNAVEQQYLNVTGRQSPLMRERVVVCPCDEAVGLRYIVRTFHAAEKGDELLTPDPSPCTDARWASVYRSRWKTVQLETEVVDSRRCAYVVDGMGPAKVIRFSCFFGAAVMLMYGVGVWRWRDTDAIKTGRPKTMLTALFGGVLLNLSNLASISPPTRVSCGFRVALLIIGFFAFMGSIFIKQVIIMNLLKQKYHLSRHQNRKKTILLRYQGATLVSLSVLCIVIWFVAAGLEPVLELSDETYGVYDLVCPSNTPVLLMYSFLGIVMILISCMIASQTQGLSGLVFSEAKFMVASNYNIAMFTAFLVAIIQLDALPVPTKAMSLSLCICLNTLIASTLVVGSRIYAALLNMSAQKSTSRQSKYSHAAVTPDVSSTHNTTSSAAIVQANK